VRARRCRTRRRSGAASARAADRQVCGKGRAQRLGKFRYSRAELVGQLLGEVEHGRLPGAAKQRGRHRGWGKGRRVVETPHGVAMCYVVQMRCGRPRQSRGDRSLAATRYPAKDEDTGWTYQEPADLLEDPLPPDEIRDVLVDVPPYRRR
jgi:hypothetical protein